MKKITFVLIFGAIFINLNNAAADNYKYVPYIGGGYQFDKAQLAEVRPQYHSVYLYVGSDYSSYFGTELFFSQSASENNKLGNKKLKSSYRAYGLDVLGYLPVDCQKKFSLAATAGFGEYTFNLKKTTAAKHHNEHGYGYRLGGGFKYVLDAHWQARLLARYVRFDKVDDVNQSLEYTLSAEYHF